MNPDEIDRSWQPIASAPMDGTKILVYTVHGDMEITEWVTLAQDVYEPVGGGLYRRIESTHGFWNGNMPVLWMPLPPEPEAVPSEDFAVDPVASERAER